uniref:Uncharacterized protein n=1 Tax=viral metagenome TaxID=1070528 RepID=A0A6H2A2X7_9ZZZZ
MSDVEKYPRMKPGGWVYVIGACRNSPDATKTHIYTGPAFNHLVGPLCGYGWNRSDGYSFSILRNNVGGRGTCQTCENRVGAGRGPVPPWPHKTRWL